MTTTHDASPLFGLILTGNRTHLTNLVNGLALCGARPNRTTSMHAITDAKAYAAGAAIRPEGSHCARCDRYATQVTEVIVAAILAGG